MNTFAEDLRMMLAEVEPELAVLITEPRNSWSRCAIWGPDLDEAKYEIVYRARTLVAARRGETMPCIECSRAVYLTQRYQPCPHEQVPA